MTWIKLDDGFPVHPKVLEVGGDAAWLYVCGLCHCSQNLTDGRIPKALIGRLSDRRNPKRLAAELVRVSLWIDDGDAWIVHDYLSHQRAREQVLLDRDKARIRQQKRRSQPSVTALSQRDMSVSHGPVTAMSRVPELDTDTDTECVALSGSKSRSGWGTSRRDSELSVTDPLVRRMLDRWPALNPAVVTANVQRARTVLDMADNRIDEAIGQTIAKNPTDPCAYLRTILRDWKAQDDPARGVA